MIIFIGFLTVVLVLDSLLLILLVLIQLPKKEAGAGVAFGGAATDALFGAGTGNVLTKTTKIATIVFFALLLVIGVTQGNYYNKTKTAKKIAESVDKAAAAAPAAAPVTTPAVTPALSNAPVSALPVLTNLPAATSTNSAPVAPK
ncbi:MAG: preprotein translocase subunit SecG [Pedosphaera sp.]|nr:preprotein translocase subunit SecG [Pedosphaera sp.]